MDIDACDRGAVVVDRLFVAALRGRPFCARLWAGAETGRPEIFPVGLNQWAVLEGGLW